jgi:hypothetical protein
MSYMDSCATGLLFFDVESAPLPDAAEYIKPGKPPANYKSAEAIEKWEAEDRADKLAKAALNPDLCRVVAIGTQRDQGAPQASWGDNERLMLESFWRAAAEPTVMLVGFNVVGFDLPILVRRSQYLGVPHVAPEMGKYRHPMVIDLMEILSFGRIEFMRSLGFYCKRFGITAGAEDTHTGADIGALVAAGEWDAVADHVRADVAKTAALYYRVHQRG